MPEDFSFKLYPDDLDRLEFYIEDAMERMPLLGTQGVERVINGPIPYAPDGLPLIGPMPGVKNAFEAHSFTFGIAQGGGAGKVLSEWIVNGAPDWDMWAVDPRRYTGYADHDYSLAKALETYGHEYAMHFPHHAWPAGRNKRLSAVHDKLLELGGQMGAYNGWERVNWFAQDGDDTSEEATQTWEREGPWYQRVKEECEAVRDACGVLDMPGFSRFDLKGEGAADWLRQQITGGIPKVGRLNLAYFADEKGRIVTEMSVIRKGDDDITLMTAAVAEWHDFEWLQKALPTDGSLSLTNHSTEFAVLLVTGPTSRDVIASIADEADLQSGWLTHQPAKIAGINCALARVSFAGELGWEIHAATEDIPALYDAVLGAGAKPFGMFALDSLRLEKGYSTWKVDLSTDYTVLEGGMERFVRWQKESFVGKPAMQAEKQQGVKKRFATMTINAGDFDAPFMSTIWKGDEVVGETTSGGWGHRVNKSIALGVVKTDLAEAGTELEVEIYGRRYAATVHPDQPLWDPENERIRA